jgi:hypothetical protein
MKKRNVLFTAIAISSIVACNDGTDSTTTTDSTSTTSTTSETSAGATGTINIRPDVSYVDLTSGKQVRLRVDTVTRYVVNAETSQPIYFYIDPSTSDTFDRSGQVVNNALIRGNDGSYTVDESRLKIKTQDDGDMKIKDGEGNKLKIDPNDEKIKMKSADGSKEMIDGDKYKSKSDTGKTKTKH